MLCVHALQAAPRDKATEVAMARLWARKGSTGGETSDDFVARQRERREEVTSGGSGSGESSCAEPPIARHRTREVACESERRDVVQQARAVGLMSHGVQTEIARIRPDQAGADQLNAMFTAEQQAMEALAIASSESDGGSSVDSDAPRLDSPPLPPPEGVEVLVQTSDGDEQPCRVELDTPLGATLLWHESAGRLWVDGDRVGEQQTPRQLGLSSVLQSFEPQTGGGGNAEANAALVHQILELENDPFELLSLGSSTQLRRATASENDLKRAQRWLAVRVHPDKLPDCPEATQATQALNNAFDRASGPEPPQSGAAGSGSDAGSDDGDASFDSDGEASGEESDDDDDASMVDDSGALSDTPRTDEEREPEEDMRDDENDASTAGSQQQQQQAQQQQAQQQQAQQQQTAAQQCSTAASKRAAEFQQHQQQRVRAPAIAEDGMEPWEKPLSGNLPLNQRHNRVTVAQLETSEVPDFGTPLRVKIREVVDGKAAVRAGTDTVPLQPTEDNTLLLEAGCASQKTRKLLLTWLKLELRENPDLPVLFVTTRKTHADDLATTVRSWRASTSSTTSTPRRRTCRSRSI